MSSLTCSFEQFRRPATWYRQTAGRTLEGGRRKSDFIDHPSGKTLQEVLEAFHMLHWKLIFHIRAFEDPVETPQPDLPRAFVDFKRNMSGSHSWRPIPLGVQRRSSHNGYE